MRRLAFALPVVLACLSGPPALAQDAKSSPPVAAPDGLKDPQAEDSYVIGLNVGAQLRSGGIPIDADALFKGVRDALANAKPALSDDQIGAVTVRLQGEMQARRQAAQALAAETNKSQGDAFMKANGARPGVVTLPSGLQYEVEKQGTGAKPKFSDTVLCNYRGTLIDGTEFDSSFGRGAPTSFALAGVIKGWSEALQLMPVGSKWKLYVPPALAYGDQAKGVVGPNATLVFEVELLAVQPAG